MSGEEIDYEANLDEFLRLAEEDAAAQAGEEIAPQKSEPEVRGHRSGGSIFNNSSERQSYSPPPRSPPRKALKDLTYEDIFGSPEKKKNENHESKRRSIRSPDRFKALGDTNQPGTSSRSVPEVRATVVKPTTVKTPSVGLDTNQVVIDPFSRIRVYKTSISLYYDPSMTAEAVLKDRNMGLQFVNLLSFNIWYRTKGQGVKNFWTSGVLTRKLPGVRKSAKGNDYTIWEINDLKELEKSWTVFLFGSSGTSSSLAYLPIGSVIDLTTPSVMDSGDSKLKFSINNPNQVRHIATAKDFGYCQATKKDGQPCTAVVNTWECCVCIHHASSELKKMGGKRSKGLGKPAVKNPQFQNRESNFDPKKEGIVTLNFGKPQTGFNKMPTANVDPISAKIAGLKNPRMELMGSNPCGGELKRNSLGMGNSSSISFKQENHEFLPKLASKSTATKPVNLDPSKTRHLTERDREILAVLGGGPTNSSEKSSKTDEKNKSFNAAVASRIASNPTAGARNWMRYLSAQHEQPGAKKQRNRDLGAEVEPITITRETIKNMKKALDFVKTSGPIKKVDPNAISKRKSLPAASSSDSSSQPTASGSSGRKRKLEIEVEFDFQSDDYKKILNAKSAHEEHLADVQQEEYFDKLGKKEAIENKLLNTFSIPTNAVMCRQCKYVALSQSDFCKGLSHPIRIVKATKRFFKCKDCGNRTMSLDRLPKHPCKNCNSSSWLSDSVGKEKKGPLLPSETLAIRGHEEKFIGAAGSKMFLNLEVS